MFRFFFYFVFISLLLITSCSSDKKTPAEQQSVFATVDGVEISETSFQRAFLPVLLYGDKFDSPETRREVMNILIGQKLLAMSAHEANLDTGARIENARGRAERKALSRKVYDEWVRKKIEVPSEEQLREGFNRGRKALFARHLYADSEAKIKDYSRRLNSGEASFYTLAQDAFADTILSKNGGALGWITFGDLDETIEDTLYTLTPGRISQPVKSQYGWHILALDDIQEELFVTEEDFQGSRSLIYNKIVDRRAALLGKQVINDFMSQYKINFNREITKLVWPEVITRLNSKEGLALINAEYDNSGSQLEALKDETLLTVNGENWTVAAIIQRLPDIDRTILQSNLYMAASNVIQNEMLSREAIRLGFQDDIDVIEEVRDSQEQLLAEIYVSVQADTMTFDSSRQKDFYTEHRMNRYHAPDSLQLELLAFKDSLSASKVLREIRSGRPKEIVTKNIIWLGPSHRNTGIYKLARSISKGTVAGPVSYKQMWTLVRLIDRKRTPLDYVKIKPRVAADMERERYSSTRNILLKGIRPKHDIIINYDQLDR
jgi:peptidyl-prolyl cis-trans isomerase C